jgi:hypothetical protein
MKPRDEIFYGCFAREHGFLDEDAICGSLFLGIASLGHPLPLMN